MVGLMNNWLLLKLVVDELKEIFKATQDLQLEIREKQIPNMPMTDLSMGMSRDYKEAIEFGSTFVRIGTAFFK